jgi:hypothetical protein
MSKVAVWHGSESELRDLTRAVQHHCECGSEWGMACVPCPAHAMLAQDQRALDGLLWARRVAQRLIAEEQLTAGVGTPAGSGSQ